jgi:HK97 family phage portal protein
MGGGEKAYTGKLINEKKALRLTAVFACIRVLAETVASLPLLVYARRDDGGKRPAPEHRLYPILHDEASPELTSLVFREALMGHVAGWGNGYAEIERDGAARPLGLWPLLPDRTHAKRDRDDGLFYVTHVKGKPIPLNPENVLHIPGLGFDGLKGYSPLAMAKQAVALGLAAEEFGARFYGQGSRPSGFITGPKAMSDPAYERLEKKWMSAHGGLENSHRAAILEEGFEWKPMGIPPEEAQFLETRKFQIEEIARIYRVPLVLLQHTEKSTSWGSGVEQFMLAFVIHTVRSWVVRWEQELNRKLFSRQERGRFFAEFKLDGLVRGDLKSRYEAYAQGRQNGWLSANDIRRLENMDPVEGGDVYLVPINMMPAELVGSMPPSQDTRPDDGDRVLPRDRRRLPAAAAARAQRSLAARRRLQAAHVAVFERAARRVVRREVDAVRAAAERFLGERTLGEFDDWLEEFYREHQDFIERTFGGTFRSFAELIHAEAAEEVGLEANFDTLQRFFLGYVQSTARREVGSSIGQLRGIMNETDPEGLQEAIEARLDEWEEGRPGKLGLQETVTLAGAMSRQTYDSAGRGAQWVTFGASCPLCEEMDGRIVSVGEPFLAAGDEVNPGDGETTPLRTSAPVTHPQLHGGCDCGISAA